ncbi:hypothetical protein FOCC_FOCC000030 [Frankliniella occidentalis]|uniref:Uncharacterized protein LOC113213479 n=1 Tax=Frankliniella occidentalis TaxID=133901 RepID=A0A6J1T9K0_FRAOC|nr:uncharacterized protein LOC113213479 [Frankliniella occidentalis]KAE8753107.1 hypothetical protein FOCC_FOCC000030 [Frankliniella occidentalis]
MVATKPNKFSRLHPPEFLGKSNNAEIPRSRKGRRKSGVKKIFLKSDARNMIAVPNDHSSRLKKKKIVCVKKRCHIKKDQKQKKLLATAQNSEDRVSSWLKNQTAENLIHQQSECTSDQAATNSSNSDMVAKSPTKGDCEISAIFQTLVPSEVLVQRSCEKLNHLEENGEEESAVFPHAEGDIRVPSANSTIFSCEDQHLKLKDDAMKPRSEESFHQTTLECNGIVDDTPENFSVKDHMIRKPKRVLGRPLCSSKKLKASSAASSRKALQRFYLKNSQGGFQLALKKFRKVRLRKTGNELLTTDQGSKITLKVPMEISVKKRLDAPPSCMMVSCTPDKDRSVCKFLVTPRKEEGLPSQKVVSCKLPFDSSVDSGLSEDDTSTPEGHTKNANQENQSMEKRDVCYIFALLDREINETVFKCSPHLKSSEILQQIASVINTISMDDDLMTAKGICKGLTTEMENSNSLKNYIDRSTSPILYCDNSEEDPQRRGGCVFEESNNDWEVPPSNVESSPEDHLGSSKQKAEGQAKTDVTSATKVMIVKALMTLTSELKIPTDISVRLLKWSSVTFKGDIDNDMCEDEFEGFLCHCHDKVSILLETCCVLDSKFIINLEEAELKNMWLLHDALCCMLQAYRYIQDLSSSPSSSFRQHLLSLMTTCAKTILPNDKISVTTWISLMTMIQGINEKLWLKDVLSKACQCHQHFISLSQSRFCRVCDLNCLYEDLCRENEKDVRTSTKIEKSELVTSTSTVLEQLFPRYCWFLSRIENLSEEEFKTAYSKHLVVKFSCNSQSGLQPCDEHLTEIACTCFSSSLAFDSQAEVDEAGSSVSETIKQDENRSSLSQDTGSDQQKLCAGDEIFSSDSVIPDSHIESNDVESLQNVTSQTDTVSRCETVSLSCGSTQSSDDYTLEFPESPGETTLDASNLKRQKSTFEERAAELNVRNSGNECGEEVEDDRDETMPDESSESPDIDYSPLKFQLAQSTLGSAFTSFDRQHSMKDEKSSLLKKKSSNQASYSRHFESKSKMPVEEITLDSESSSDISECMMNVSTGEDSVFGSSPTRHLVNETTTCLANQASFSDSTTETENGLFIRQEELPDADQSTSASLQSFTSCDSAVPSQNEQLKNDGDVSSSNIKSRENRKYEMDANFNGNIKKSKLNSPPLYNVGWSSESGSSDSYHPSPQLNQEIKSLGKSEPLDVGVMAPSKEDKDLRTQSSRNLRSEKSSRKKEVDKMKELEPVKTTHSIPTRKPVLRSTNSVQSLTKNQDVAPVNCVDGKELSEELQYPRASVRNQAQSSLRTKGCVQQQDVTCDHDSSQNDVNQEVRKPKGDHPFRKKHLSLSKRNNKTECSDLAQTTKGIQTRRSTFSKTADHQHSQNGAVNKIMTAPIPKQESLNSCSVKDGTTSQQCLGETENNNLSHLKGNKKIVNEDNSQSAASFNERKVKSTKLSDESNITDYQECSLTSILKVGNTTKNEQDRQSKRNIPEAEPEDSSNYTKKVRFSSPDNSYHIIEDRRELQKLEKSRQSEINYLNGQTSTTSKHKKQERISISCDVVPFDRPADSNILAPTLEVGTKPDGERKSCLKTPKVESEVLSSEGKVAVKAKSNLKKVLTENGSDPQAVNHDSNTHVTSQMTQKKELTSSTSSVSELPVKIKKERVQSSGKKNLPPQLSSISAQEEIVMKSNKRKKSIKTEEELSIKPLVNPSSPSNDEVEVLETLQKPKKNKKSKVAKNVKDSATNEEDFQCEASDSSWNAYLSTLRARMLEK